MTLPQFSHAVGMIVGLILLAAFCFAPSIIVLLNKGKASKGPTIVINVLLGWTVIGWIIALAMSFSKDPRQQSVQFIQNLPPATPEK